MDEETKKKLKEAGLDSVIAAHEKLESDLKAEKDGRAADKATHEKTVKEKDEIIKQKTDDVVGARKQYKKLSEMSAEEREQMSAKEIELQERQERLEGERAQFEKEQKERQEREIGERKTKAIEKIVGRDPELRQKVEDAFGKIKDSDKAVTESEIAQFAEQAFNMLGVPKPDPVQQATMGGQNGEAGGDTPADFSQSEKGKELAGALGLNQAKPDEQKPEAK